MELGQKLKQARLDAGLSQRQLCGDTITRNMLSQIENGSAKPSLATMQALCARLGKPVSFFWEDAPSENLTLLKEAASASPKQALQLLQRYLSPDPLLDTGYYLLLTRCYMTLGEQALQEGRTAYAQSLLKQAMTACENAGDSGCIFQRKLTVLQAQAETDEPAVLAANLPDNSDEMLLRAKAALAQNNPQKALSCLDAADRQTPDSLLLKGDALMQGKDYQKAIDCFLALEHQIPLYARLEICYRELGDFQKAYEYACKQRL